MTGRTRLIAAIAGALALLLLFYFFLIRPRRAELAEVRAQVAAEEQRTATLQLELQRLQELQANAPQLEAELAEIRQYVPRNHETANFIFQVQDAANEAGVDFVTITPELPKQPPEGAALAQVRIVIGTEGGYFAVQDFMRRLYNLDRALRIDVMTMTGNAEGTPGTAAGGVTLNLEITSRVFFELPGTGATNTGATATDTDTTTDATEG